VRRRQRESINKTSRSLTFSAFSSPGCSNGVWMYRRKAASESKGLALMKANRAPISSSLFWMGVPVRHQRELASSSAQERWKMVACRRMMCATGFS